MAAELSLPAWVSAAASFAVFAGLDSVFVLPPGLPSLLCHCAISNHLRRIDFLSFSACSSGAGCLTCMLFVFARNSISRWCERPVPWIAAGVVGKSAALATVGNVSVRYRSSAGDSLCGWESSRGGIFAAGGMCSVAEEFCCLDGIRFAAITTLVLRRRSPTKYSRPSRRQYLTSPHNVSRDQTRFNWSPPASVLRCGYTLRPATGSPCGRGPFAWLPSGLPRTRPPGSSLPIVARV